VAETPKSQTEESDIASMEFQKKTKADRTVPISAASVITGIEVHTLRYWEREFAEFLNPVRTAGGQRRYGPEDIQTLFLIKRLLRDEMFSIAGARKHLIKQFSTVAA
jgi:DNA-binding transcriptional MerR regulator